MTRKVSLPTSLKNLRLAYGEIAEMYGLQEIDVERSLDEAILRYYGTENFWLSGDGLQLNGQYKTMRKKEFQELYEIFVGIVKREHHRSFLTYVKQILALNKNILYCEPYKEVKKDGTYILKPLMSKDKHLPYTLVTVKMKPSLQGNHVVFPEKLKRIPVYIDQVKRNEKRKNDVHWVVARGEIMNQQTAQRHLEILNKRFKKNYDIDLELKVEQSYDSGVKLKYKSTYTLPVSATKIIGNYFRSFNVQAYINQ